MFLRERLLLTKEIEDLKGEFKIKTDQLKVIIKSNSEVITHKFSKYHPKFQMMAALE